MGHYLTRAANEGGELVADDPLVRRMTAGLGRLDRQGRAEGVNLDDVGDDLGRQAGPDEADADDEEDDEFDTGDERRQAPLARELEVAIVPLAPRLDVRVGVGHGHPD